MFEYVFSLPDGVFLRCDDGLDFDIGSCENSIQSIYQLFFYVLLFVGIDNTWRTFCVGSLSTLPILLANGDNCDVKSENLPNHRSMVLARCDMICHYFSLGDNNSHYFTVFSFLRRTYLFIFCNYCTPHQKTCTEQQPEDGYWCIEPMK